MSDRSALRTVLWLALLGFVLRVVAIYLPHPRYTLPNAIEHRTLALSLIQNGTFYFRDFDYYGPSSVQSPPYPFLLATLFKLFGPDSTRAYIAAMVINAVAGGLTVLLSYLLVRAIGGARTVGVIAAALVAVWPSQIYASTHVQ